MYLGNFEKDVAEYEDEYILSIFVTTIKSQKITQGDKKN